MRMLLGGWLVATPLLCSAADPAPLGVDYQAITHNEVLARFMREIEPALVRYYESSEFAVLREAEMIRSQAKNVAWVLSTDSSNQSNIRLLRKVATPADLMMFLQLDKSEFPNLWNFGELVRLEGEVDKSRRLYDALHGERYPQNSAH